MPASRDLAWFVVRLIDLTAAAEALAVPPPGQSMTRTSVLCWPSFARSTVPDAWKSAASCVEMASSLNHIETLCWLPYSAVAQLLAVNFRPVMTPVAEHRFCACAPRAQVKRTMANSKWRVIASSAITRSEAACMGSPWREQLPQPEDLRLGS